MNTIRSILFTHNDMDGTGCRILYELYHWYMDKGRDYMVFPCTNQSLDRTVLQMMGTGVMNTRTEVCFTDIAPCKEVMDQVVNRFTKVRVWDHHLVRTYLQEYPNVILMDRNDMGVAQSATSLLYQWYCNNAFQHPADPGARYFSKDGNQVLLSRLVDTIRSYDTYEWKQTGTILPKKLQTLFFLLEEDRFADRYINRVKKDLTHNEILLPTDMEFVDAKMEYEKRVINSFIPDNVYTIDVRGYKTAFVVSTRGANTSELGYQFLKKYPDYDLFISFTFAHGGHFSMRTNRPDIDVGKLAEAIGGGGHQAAAGAYISDLCMAHFIKVLTKQLNRKAKLPQQEFIESPEDPDGEDDE